MLVKFLALVLQVPWLLAPAKETGFDTVFLRPRGWPQIECRLSPQSGATGAPGGDEARADFWMRGRFSQQFYRCRLDAPDDVSNRLLAAGRDGQLQLTARWRINLNKFRRAHWPNNFQLMSATSTPQFDCLAGDTPLPGSVFPLTGRRPGAHWHKCFAVPDSYHGESFLNSDGLVTISFRGGAPTVVCGVSTGAKPTPLQMGTILPPAYSCFFATYLDFPSLSDPPASQLFQKLVVDKWTPTFSTAFPPFQCWPKEEDSSSPFDFEVLVDGKHAHRCLFEAERPHVSTVAPTLDSSTEEVQATMKDSIPSAVQTTLDSLLVSKLNFGVSDTNGIADEVTTTSSSFSESENIVY